MNSNNLIREERKSRIATGNRYFYSPRQILRCSAMSKTFKSKMCMLISLVVSRCETWAMTDGYEKTEYMGEENIKSDICISGRARNMENKN